MLPAIIIIIVLLTALVAFDSDVTASTARQSRARSLIGRMLKWIK